MSQIPSLTVPRKKPSVNIEKQPWIGFSDLENLRQLFTKLNKHNKEWKVIQKWLDMFFVASFLFGSRRAETLSLKKSNLSVIDKKGTEFVQVTGMLLEKQKTKTAAGRVLSTDEYNSSRVRNPFVFKLNEGDEDTRLTFAKEFLDWIDTRDEYIFCKEGEQPPDFEYTPRTIDKKFHNVRLKLEKWRDTHCTFKDVFPNAKDGRDITYNEAFFNGGTASLCFPHGLRSIRASQLVSVYNFNTFDLRAWFSWKSDEMPSRYAKAGLNEMYSKMAI